MSSLHLSPHRCSLALQANSDSVHSGSAGLAPFRSGSSPLPLPFLHPPLPTAPADDAHSAHSEPLGPAAPPSVGSVQSSKAQVFDDASAEIADIDSRLHALQSFLRMAKSSTTSTATTAT